MLVNVVMQCFYCFTFLGFLLLIRAFVLYCSHVPMYLFRKSPSFMGDKVQSMGSQCGKSTHCLFLFAVNHPKLTCIGAFAIKTLSECVCVIFCGVY